MAVHVNDNLLVLQAPTMLETEHARAAFCSMLERSPARLAHVRWGYRMNSKFG